MSVLKIGVIVAACAAIGVVTSKLGTCQDGGAKGKQAVEEKWADDPAPPDRPQPMAFPAGPAMRGDPPRGPI